MRVVPLPVDGQGVVRGGGAWQGDELHWEYRRALQGVQLEVRGTTGSVNTLRSADTDDNIWTSDIGSWFTKGCNI